VTKTVDSIRIALVQARTAPDMIVQEHECFLERLHLHHDQIVGINITNTAVSVDICKEVDAVFIGGAGEFSATENYHWIQSLLKFVRELSDLSFPLFGSCWGHQIIARALGGEVIYDPERAEMGCHHVFLTDEGKQDRLFQDFPASFLANMGHHDRVTKLPPDGIELADNKTQPFQAFRIAGKPIYGTQFHSELDAHRERERLIRYRPYYLKELPDEDQFKAVMANLAETTDVDHLMRDFLRKFVLDT
jgi:GMP synthase (glutamine-hydrolysing)